MKYRGVTIIGSQLKAIDGSMNDSVSNSGGGAVTLDSLEAEFLPLGDTVAIDRQVRLNLEPGVLIFLGRKLRGRVSTLAFDSDHIAWD